VEVEIPIEAMTLEELAVVRARARLWKEMLDFHLVEVKRAMAPDALLAPRLKERKAGEIIERVGHGRTLGSTAWFTSGKRKTGPPNAQCPQRTADAPPAADVARSRQ